MNAPRRRPRRLPAQGRTGELGRSAIALLLATLAAAILTGLLSAVAGAATTTPGRILSDAELDPDHHSSPPPGWVDVRTPLVQEPSGPVRPAATKRTNIIVVMVDDMPETDDRVLERLPTIKRLFLDQGLKFTRYHGNDPLCCPGRANFLTGLTTSHHGVWTNDARLLDPRETIATELKKKGYFTFLAGKYLNMFTSAIKPPPGWSRWAYSDNGYYDYTEILDGKRVHHDLDPEDYQPDVAFNRAMQFLRDTPADRPVFGWITPFSVHGAVDPRTHVYSPYPELAPRAVKDPRCDDIEPWKTPAHSDDNSDRPAYQHGWNKGRAGWDMERICRALLPVDQGLARVLKELKKQGRLGSTMIVFTADNGMGWGAHGQPAKDVTFATQLPLFIWWPAGRGRSADKDPSLVSNVDLAPTLCDLAGCVLGPYPDGRKRPDGTSLLPLIKGTGRLVRQAIFTQDRATGMSWWAVRTGPDSPLGLWHYAEYETGERELYDTSGGPCWRWQEGDPGDPCELTNLAGKPTYAAVEAKLHDLLALAMATGGNHKKFRGHTEPIGTTSARRVP